MFDSERWTLNVERLTFNDEFFRLKNILGDELWDLLTEEQKNMFSIVGSQTLILKNSE